MCWAEIGSVIVIKWHPLSMHFHDIVIMSIWFVLFVSLGFFRPTRECFTHMETSPLVAKDCTIWPMLGTYGRLSVRVPNACNFCVKGHPFIMIKHTLCRAFGSGAVNTCFKDLGLSRMGFELPTLHLRTNASNSLRHRNGLCPIENAHAPSFQRTSY